MFVHFILSLLFAQCIFAKSNSPKADYVFNLKYLEKLKANTKTGYIELNQEHLKKFSTIEHNNRDFHLFVLFTSLDPSMGCAACP